MLKAIVLLILLQWLGALKLVVVLCGIWVAFVIFICLWLALTRRRGPNAA